MSQTASSLAVTSRNVPRFQLRVWNVALIVLFVAIAIVDIRDQTRREPFLVALASAGFVGYGLIGWLGWRSIRRLENRLGPLSTPILYMVAMAAFFLLATVAYLVLEHAYFTGGLARLGRWAGISTPAIFRRSL
jgi:hypothetical protein